MKRTVNDIRIVFVGAGNLASGLAKAFRRQGARIVQVYSRTEIAARTLAAEVGAEHTADLSQLSGEGDLYVVALKDDVVKNLLPVIAAARRDALFVHTAGSLPLSVWEGSGAGHYGVLYPLQTFSKRREVDFRVIPLLVEAARPSDAARLKEIAGMVSDRVLEVTSEQRRSLHLSAVFACNFTNHLYDLAARLLEKAGLPFSLLLPLIDETTRKVHELSPRDAQTGPAVRNDLSIIESHLDALSATPEVQEIYKLLSRSIYEHHQL